MVSAPDRPAAGALLGRALLLLVATLVIVWLAGNYRSVRLASDGAALIAGARKAPAPQANLAAGHRAYQRARRFSPDTLVLVEEAGKLVVAGYRERAVGPAREATRREPDSYDAWAVLYAATVGADPATAARARRKVLSLDPRAGAR